MKKELAVKLKKAGYPQPTGYEKSGTWKGVRRCNKGECVYYPTLEELVDEVIKLYKK